MTETRLRRCAGCGHEFRSAGEEFCSSICAGNAAMAGIVAGLQEYARTHPIRVG